MVAGNRGMAPGRVLSRPTNCPETSRRAPEEAQGPSQVSCARACRRSDHHPIRYAKRYRQVLCRRVEDLCLCGNEPVKGLPYCETRASHMRFLNRLEKLEAKAIVQRKRRPITKQLSYRVLRPIGAYSSQRHAIV